MGRGGCWEEGEEQRPGPAPAPPRARARTRASPPATASDPGEQRGGGHVVLTDSAPALRGSAAS